MFVARARPPCAQAGRLIEHKVECIGYAVVRAAGVCLRHRHWVSANGLSRGALCAGRDRNVGVDAREEGKAVAADSVRLRAPLAARGLGRANRRGEGCVVLPDSLLGRVVWASIDLVSGCIVCPLHWQA